MGKLKLKKRSGGAYFLDQSQDVEYVSSGAEVLDCVIGGGYGLGRIVNIVGDKSTGKTLLAIEACCNFIRLYPKGRIRYAEPEAALSRGYAEALGLPVNRVAFGGPEIDTVEAFYDDLDEFLDSLKTEPGVYILDSLDALSSAAEQGRKFGDAAYGDGKAKDMSKLFRMLTAKIKTKRVLVIIISQVRDNIGVTFGSKLKRSGGRALDFYASQVFWLAQMGSIKRAINRITRTTGVIVKARCTKNKVGVPFRECNLELRYGYGVDDVASNVKWLAEVGRLNLVKTGLGPGDVTRFLNEMESLSPEVFNEYRKRIAEVTRRVWKEVETAFLPTRRKYS